MTAPRTTLGDAVRNLRRRAGTNEQAEPVAAEVEALQAAFEQAVLALAAVDEQLGEAIHVGLRKGADGGGSGEAWRAIKAMDNEQWSNAVQFAVDGMGVTAALATPAARAVLAIPLVAAALERARGRDATL